MSTTIPHVDHTPNSGNTPPPCSFWAEGDPSTSFFTGTFGDVADAYLAAVSDHEPHEKPHEYPWVQFRGAVLAVELPWAEGLAATDVAVRGAVHKIAGHPVPGLLLSDWRSTHLRPGWAMLVALDRAVEADELGPVLAGLRRALRAGKVLAPDPVADVADDGSTVTWSVRMHARFDSAKHKDWRMWARVVRWDDPNARPLSVDALIREGDGVPDEQRGGDLSSDTVFIAAGISYTLDEFSAKNPVGAKLRGKCWETKSPDNKEGCCVYERVKDGVRVVCFGGKGTHTHDHARSTRTGKKVMSWFWSAPAVAQDGAWAHLARSKDDAVLPSLDNAVAVLVHDHGSVGGCPAYDAFRDRVYVGKDELTDHAVGEMRLAMTAKYGMRVGKDTAFDAVEVVAHRAVRDDLRAYVEGLRWDGVERLATFCSTHLGAEDTPLHRAYVRSFFVQGALRAIHPGAKADNVLVLMGPQGKRKSSLAAALCPDPEWFLDDRLDVDSDEAAKKLQGRWIVEFAELASLRKAEVEAVKTFIDRKVDSYRPSYGRCVVNRPRRCVFIATTNSYTPLVDATGNRRFLCIALPRDEAKLDVDAVAAVRDQLWAEAAVLVRRGEKGYLPPEVEALQRAANEDHRVEDPTVEAVLTWASRQVTPFSLRTAIVEGLGVTVADANRHSARVGEALRAAGYVREDNPTRVDGERTRRWSRPGMTGPRADPVVAELFPPAPSIEQQIRAAWDAHDTERWAALVQAHPAIGAKLMREVC